MTDRYRWQGRRGEISLSAPAAQVADPLAAALAQLQAGHLGEAERLCRMALARRPRNPQAHHCLGAILHRRGDHAPARAAFERALEVEPDNANFHRNLGVGLEGLGEAGRAVACYEEAARLAPGFHDAHASLADLLFSRGDAESAVKSYERALAIRPASPHLLNGLGNALRQLGRPRAAISRYDEALRLDPGLGVALANRGTCLQELGEIGAALESLERAVEITGHPGVHSNLVMTLSYAADTIPERLHAAHLRWAARHASAVPSTPGAARREPTGERLRIGYVSGDLRGHPVGQFLAPILARHDRGAFEIFCYSNAPHGDDLTERMRAHADHWHEIAALPDEQAAALVAGHAIDVLVDLSGHSARNRLPLFARRPAPVQATWLGYPNTTGLARIDWRFTDARCDPKDQTEHLHSERLARLPRCFIAYAPPDDAPGVGPLPCRNNRHVTFGSFNNLAKVNDRVLSLWARILLDTPGARLLIKSKLFQEPETRVALVRRLRARAVERERVELVEWTPSHRAHMDLYNRVDIALDTLPYHGTTTTCEALWMGVPVITAAGPDHRSRVGASLLGAVHLDALVAADDEDYVQRAVRLAAQPAKLAKLRETLRARVEDSPLADVEGFTRRLETVYRRFAVPRARGARASTPARPVVRVIHHLARTGGTLFARCLGCMEGVVLLSEVHPARSAGPGPLRQAREWHGLADLDDDDAAVDFGDAVARIAAACSTGGRSLVLRDWSHLDFHGVPFVEQPTFDFATAEALHERFALARIATVRHPLDQWLSLEELAVVKGRLDLERFLLGCRRFAEHATRIGFVRYEDLVADPPAAMRRLCECLALPFDPGFAARWAGYQKVTGDLAGSPSRRAGARIVAHPRRAAPPALLEAVEANEDYRRTVALLGYR